MADTYRDLQHTGAQVDDTIADFAQHDADTVRHVTAAERASWNEKADAAALSAETSAREAADREMQAAIGAVANAGAKNLLKLTARSQTIKGVTFTVNDDQTVTVNGTNDGTGASEFVIVPNKQAITIPDGDYILSGCPKSGGESAPFDLRWYMYSTGKSAYDSGNGASVKKKGNGEASNVAIVVKTGQTANRVVFKPMLRYPETDSKFAPYAPTNRELYEMILALQSGGASTQSTASLMSAMPGNSAEITADGEPREEVR